MSIEQIGLNLDSEGMVFLPSTTGKGYRASLYSIVLYCMEYLQLAQVCNGCCRLSQLEDMVY